MQGTLPYGRGSDSDVMIHKGFAEFYEPLALEP